MTTQVPGRNLDPAIGTFARCKLQEWLTFIDTEIHGTFLSVSHFGLVTLRIYCTKITANALPAWHSAFSFR